MLDLASSKPSKKTSRELATHSKYLHSVWLRFEPEYLKKMSATLELTSSPGTHARGLGKDNTKRIFSTVPTVLWQTGTHASRGCYENHSLLSSNFFSWWWHLIDKGLKKHISVLGWDLYSDRTHHLLATILYWRWLAVDRHRSWVETGHILLIWWIIHTI